MTDLSRDRTLRGAARPRLVIADDDPELPLLLSVIFGRTCEVLLAPDGYTALQLISGRGADLLISDLEMPAMRGDELLRRARQIDPIIACIILSGHPEERWTVTRGLVSPDAFVQKPFDIGHLQAVVEEVLRHRQRALRSEVISPPIAG